MAIWVDQEVAPTFERWHDGRPTGSTYLLGRYKGVAHRPLPAITTCFEALGSGLKLSVDRHRVPLAVKPHRLRTPSVVGRAVVRTAAPLVDQEAPELPTNVGISNTPDERSVRGIEARATHAFLPEPRYCQCRTSVVAATRRGSLALRVV